MSDDMGLNLSGDDQGDQRKLRRRHLIYYLRVFVRDTHEMVGHLVDVTPEGIMLISEKPITMGKVFELRMDLPVQIWGKEHMDFDAETVWCERDTNPDFFNTGFRMTNADWRIIDTIERVINMYGFSD